MLGLGLINISKIGPWSVGLKGEPAKDIHIEKIMNEQADGIFKRMSFVLLIDSYDTKVKLIPLTIGRHWFK